MKKYKITYETEFGPQNATVNLSKLLQIAKLYTTYDIDILDNEISDTELINNAATLIKDWEEESPIKFGRWLLKYCEPVHDGQYLTWVFNGIFKDTYELYDEYKINPLGLNIIDTEL